MPTVHGVQVTGGSKLDPRSTECRLIGYASGSGNYKVQDITSRRVFVSRDVVFEEGLPRRTSVSGQQIPLFEVNVDGGPLAYDDRDNDGTQLSNDHLDDSADADQRNSAITIAPPTITVEPR